MLSRHFLLILKPCYNYQCIWASSRVPFEFEEKITFYHFSKKCLFSIFRHIEAQLPLKNGGYPRFSFWISIAPDMIYLCHIIIIWEKILPISGHCP